MNIYKIDLNKLTEKYNNKQKEWVFIRNAIKSAIIDTKLNYGNNTKIEFIERKSNNKPFDIAINCLAKEILENWEAE